MADIVIIAANVVAGPDAKTEAGTAGETITAGQTAIKDTVTGKYVKADSNAASELMRKTRGIALNGASLDQPLVIQKGGDITIGATLTPGTAYYQSDTPGGICPFADVGSGEYVCLLGLAKSASVLAIDIQYPGVSL